MRTGLLTAMVLVLGTHALLAEALEVSIGDARVVEGDKGDRAADLTVLLSEPAPAPVTMTYATRDGTAVAGADYRMTSGTLTFTAGETRRTVTITVIGNTAGGPDKRLEVVLGGITGATAADVVATLTIINDDLPPGNLSTYDVRFLFRGFTGSMAGADGCPVRPDGTVVMNGLVSGNEKVSADDDIVYKGVLQFDADLDMCDAITLANGEDRLCFIRVFGSGSMNVELEAYADERDGYVKVAMVPGSFLKGLTGSCDAGLIMEEADLFPNDSQATIFNGLELPLRGPLRYGQYKQDNVVLDVVRVVRP